MLCSENSVVFQASCHLTRFSSVQACVKCRERMGKPVRKGRAGRQREKRTIANASLGAMTWGCPDQSMFALKYSEWNTSHHKPASVSSLTPLLTKLIDFLSVGKRDFSSLFCSRSQNFTAAVLCVYSVCILAFLCQPRPFWCLPKCFHRDHLSGQTMLSLFAYNFWVMTFFQEAVKSGGSFLMASPRSYTHLLSTLPWPVG